MCIFSFTPRLFGGEIFPYKNQKCVFEISKAPNCRQKNAPIPKKDLGLLNLLSEIVSDLE
jgi:hypothetical protein